MAFDLKSEFGEHKKILLPVAGLALVAIFFTTLSSSTGLSVNNNLNTTVMDTSENIAKNNMYNSAPVNALKSGVDYQAEMVTNYGTIIIDLYEENTPVTVNNFVFLANEKYYDGLTFHRVMEDFMIQGGDPTGQGIGGPGYSFVDEMDAEALDLGGLKEQYEALGFTYTTGFGTKKFSNYTLAMANSGPDSNGSQFFITSKAFTSPHLNGKHTVFGKVISGFGVVDDIEKVDVGVNDKPISEVIIKSVTIVEK